MPYLTAAFSVGCLMAYLCKTLFQIHWILGCFVPILLIGIGRLLRIRFSVSVPMINRRRSEVESKQDEKKKQIFFLYCLYFMTLGGFLRCGAIYVWENEVFSQNFNQSNALCFVESKENAAYGSYKYVISSREFAGKAIFYLSQSMEVGDSFVADINLSRIENDGNPGEFDQFSYQRIRGIYFQGKAYHVQITEANGRNLFQRLRQFVLSVLERTRNNLIVRLKQVLPEKEAGFLAAMLLGDDSFLDANLKTTFRSVGISHLLVISGLHLGILYSLLHAALSRLKNVRLQSDLMFLLLGGYVFLTGAALSTIRAWIFCGVKAFQKRLSGKPDQVNTVFFTTLLLMIWNPLNLLDTGFQLSFGCVLGISALKRWETLLLGIHKKIRKAIFSMISVNLISMPLSIWYFGVASPYQFFLNLILIPAMSILVPFAYVILILSLFWTQGAMAGASIFSGMFFGMNQIVNAAMQLPWAVLSIPRPPLPFLILYGVLLFWGYGIFPKIRKKSTGAFVPILIIMTMAFVWMIEPRTRVAFLNVGQGDCCVVEAEGTVWLVDAGPHYSKAIRPYLAYRGITNIDGILISHFDKDHIESLSQILSDDRIQVNRIYLPCHQVHENEKADEIVKMAEAMGASIQYLQRGMIFSQGEMTWKCLSPSPDTDYSDENSASMVLLLELEEKRFLFCGDADLYAEERYASLITETVDVMKAGHHGSSTSSGELLLNQAQPQEAVISCERNNSYGHPHVDTVQRFENIGSNLLITYESGAIVYLKGLTGWSQRLGS